MTSLAVLLTLADSRLPTGAHVHSGGIEEAIAAGMVTGLATLEAFLQWAVVGGWQRRTRRCQIPRTAKRIPHRTWPVRLHG